MTKNNSIPVLVIEDCELTNMMVEEVASSIGTVNVFIATTKKEAIEILRSRNDIKIAFVDWFLEHETSEWIIEIIKTTQLWVREIFATSSHIHQRHIQVSSHWATAECSKEGIVHKIRNIYAIIH